MRRHDGARLLAGTPWRLLAATATIVLTVAALVVARVVPREALTIATVALGHGALLGTALAWAGASRHESAALIALVVIAVALARMHPLGALVYVAPPIAVAWLAAHGRLRRLGLGTPCPVIAVALGAAAGLFLGTHLLLSAAQTLAYRVRLDLDRVGPAVLYDVGVQVLATELLFRGGLYNRAQRRWSFGAATSLATGASLARYLIDPLLPRAVEIVLGMVFYVSLLGVTTCWLLWRFGTLVPGLVASLLFFAAYRTLVAQ
jgi:hypothetical protein